MKHFRRLALKAPAFPRPAVTALALQVFLLCSLLLCNSARAQISAEHVDFVLGVGHSHYITKVSFSPDGRTIVSGSFDNTIRLWDAASGREFRILNGHSLAVTSVAFSSDGRTIVSGSRDNTVKLWDAVTGKELRTLSGHKDWIDSIAISPDGRTVASSGRDNTLRLWDAENGIELRTLQAASALEIAFSPDGRTVAAGGPYPVKIWDVTSGRELRTLGGDTNLAQTFAFSYDGQTAVSSSDGAIKLWEMESGRVLKTLSLSEHAASVAVSSNGKVASGSSYGVVRLWDAASSKPHTIGRHGFDRVSTVAFSPDGQLVVFGSHDHTMKVWDSTTGNELRTLGGQTRPVYSLGFSPDGRTVLSGSRDNKLSLWDASTGRELRTLSGHFSLVSSVALSPDGRTAVSGGLRDGLVKLWDIPTGRELRVLGSHFSGALSVSFSPNGRRAVSGGRDNVARLWDVATGQELGVLKGHSYEVNAVSFSPDGRMIASGGNDKNLKLWDAASGKELRTLNGHVYSIDSIGFSPDSRTIASGSNDSTITLWDVASGRSLRTLNGHSDQVNSVVFSSDGRTIASGSRDNTLKLWDALSGRELRTLRGHSDDVNAVAFSPTANSIVSGSSDGSIRRWATDGRLLASSIAAPDGEWLTLTPEGFFDASSPKAAQAVSIVRGLESFSIDQFYNQLYRPDLVREKLAGDPNGKVREAAARLDLTKAVASGNAPRSRILAPSSSSEVRGEQATVEAEIADQGGGIGKVEWRVNGVTLGVEERGFKRTDASARTIKVSRTLGLTPGENKIAVLAYNEAGLIASEPAEVTVTSVQQAAGKPRLYVLAVGVNDYWDSALKLSYAAPDAKRLGEGLKQAGDKLYEQVEVRTVLDAEATAEKLEGVFTELGKKVRSQDVFVFFLAGHGKTVDARFYFLPQDFRYVGEDSITKKGVGQNQLQGWVSRIKAQKSVLLFDACESGSLVGDKIAMRGIEEKTAIDRMTRAMGRTVLTATTDSKPAIEGYRGHGVFTYTLLAGFNAADANGDGVVDVTELAQYVDRRLPDLTYEAFKLRQVPQMSIVGSNFPLASKVALLSADGAGTASATIEIPTKPTHVVAAPAEVYEQVAGKGAKLQQLSPGTLVSLVKTEQGWVLVARDGKAIGYVAENQLMRVQ